jgi:hypothetical protein
VATLAISCGAPSPSQNGVARSEEQLGALRVTRSSDASLLAKGTYPYNEGDEYLFKIVADVWAVAQAHQEAKQLTLSLTIVGEDQYGKRVEKECEAIPFDRLDEMRKYRTFEHYSKSAEGLTNATVILAMMQRATGRL